jgi:hypothetical protein
VKSAQYEVYAIPLQQQLPAIRVPLRPGDSDVRLELQPLIDTVYETGRYDIDYHQQLAPPLGSFDREWVQGLVEARPRQGE